MKSTAFINSAGVSVIPGGVAMLAELVCIVHVRKKCSRELRRTTFSSCHVSCRDGDDTDDGDLASRALNCPSMMVNRTDRSR